MLHERFGNSLFSVLGTGPLPIYDWLVYGLVVVPVVGLIFVPFLLGLSPGTAVRIVLAGALFVSGAVGVEMLGALSASHTITLFDTPKKWIAQSMTEEFLEMIGVIVLIHAILHHLSTTAGLLSVRVN